MVLDRCLKTGKILSAKETKRRAMMIRVNTQTMLFACLLVVVATAIVTL